MTAPANEPSVAHGAWLELAAGWALNCLDREDELAFGQHLATCARCQQETAAHLETAGHLSTLVPGAVGAAPPMPLKLRHEAGLVLGARGRAVRTWRSVQRHKWATTAAAASIALVVGTVAGVALSHSSPSTNRTVVAGPARLVDAAMAAVSTGSVVPLAAPDGKAHARVAVLDAHGYLIADGHLPTLSGSGEQYVVWAQRSGERMRPLVGFDSTTASAIVDLGQTGTDNVAFGVSREAAGRLPSAPGALVLA